MSATTPKAFRKKAARFFHLAASKARRAERDAVIARVLAAPKLTALGATYCRGGR